MGIARSGAFATSLLIATSQNGHAVSLRRTCRLHAGQTTRLVMKERISRGHRASPRPPCRHPLVGSLAPRRVKPVQGTASSFIAARAYSASRAVDGSAVSHVLKAAGAHAAAHAAAAGERAAAPYAASRTAHIVKAARGPVGDVEVPFAGVVIAFVAHAAQRRRSPPRT